MSTYLMSRPGRPLHLAVYAADRAEYQGSEPWTTVRPVPLCGQDRGVQWRITGPWAEGWERDRKADTCSHCLKVLAGLNAAAGDPR